MNLAAGWPTLLTRVKTIFGLWVSKDLSPANSLNFGKGTAQNITMQQRPNGSRWASAHLHLTWSIELLGKGPCRKPSESFVYLVVISLRNTLGEAVNSGIEAGWVCHSSLQLICAPVHHPSSSWSSGMLFVLRPFRLANTMVAMTMGNGGQLILHRRSITTRGRTAS